MDSSQAREHLDAAAEIVRAADRSFHIPPGILIVWGAFATLVNAAQQAQALGFHVPGGTLLQLPLLLAAIAATVWLSRRATGVRETSVDRHGGTVFLVVLGVLLIVNFTAQHRVISYEAMGLFWSVGLAMALLIVGLEASRPLLSGGAFLVATSVAACFFQPWFSGLLAVGWLGGLVVPGIVLLRRPTDG